MISQWSTKLQEHQSVCNLKIAYFSRGHLNVVSHLDFFHHYTFKNQLMERGNGAHLQKKIFSKRSLQLCFSLTIHLLFQKTMWWRKIFLLIWHDLIIWSRSCGTSNLRKKEIGMGALLTVLSLNQLMKPFRSSGFLLT